MKFCHLQHHMDGLIFHYSKGNKVKEILYDIIYGESKKNTTNVNITTTKKQTHRYRGQNSGRERQYKDVGVGDTNYWV